MYLQITKMFDNSANKTDTTNMDKLVRAIVIRILILVSLIFCVLLAMRSEAHAEIYSTGMLGVFNSGKSSLSETKALDLGIRDNLGILTEQKELGLWLDRAGNGRSSSAFLAYLLGITAEGPLTARFMVGPALISSPDTYLGGVFQFTEELYLGIKGVEGNKIGLKYKHLSSAGLETPNKGRDFLGIEIALPF